MSKPDGAAAIEAVEQELVAAKREAKEFERLGLPVPGHVERRIENLKGAAIALRKRKAMTEEADDDFRV